MNNEAMKEVLNELFSHLERLETQNEAILQFLKEKKRLTDKQLTPYLEQAGNASNVKWRAVRVRIDHLLEPEQQEKEVKLGKKPELHEDSSIEKQNEPDDNKGRRAEPLDEESKRMESGQQKQVESSDSKSRHATPDDQAEQTPAKAIQRPTDGKAGKPEEKSESKPRNTEQPTQDQHKQKSESDGLHHPTEVTEPGAEQHRAAPAAQLKRDKTDNEKEAA